MDNLETTLVWPAFRNKIVKIVQFNVKIKCFAQPRYGWHSESKTLEFNAKIKGIAIYNIGMAIGQYLVSKNSKASTFQSKSQAH